MTKDDAWTMQDTATCEALLWNAEESKFTDEFTKFQQKVNFGNFNDIFVGRSEFKPQASSEAMSDDKRLFKDILSKMTCGFTSSEKKLNELQEGGKSI